MRLFHVSETPGIVVFEPRVAVDAEAKVWAIEERTLANYLLPRDCPRICLRAGANSTATDLGLLQGAQVVIAIDAGWLQRIESATLHLYEMPPEGFTREDDIAGYWTSRQPVLPRGCEEVTDLPARIAQTGAQLVALPSLWPLHDRVSSSTLAFSMIRMRNAAPRD